MKVFVLMHEYWDEVWLIDVFKTYDSIPYTFKDSLQYRIYEREVLE